MPVEADRPEGRRLALLEIAGDGEPEEHAERDEPDRDVEAVEAGEREERGGEEVGADGSIPLAKRF